MELQQTQRHASSPQVFVEFHHESALHKSNAPHAFHPVLLCSCCFRLSRIDAILSCGALSEQSVSSSFHFRFESPTFVFWWLSMPLFSSFAEKSGVGTPSEMNRNEAQGVATNGGVAQEDGRYMEWCRPESEDSNVLWSFVLHLHQEMYETNKSTKVSKYWAIYALRRKHPGKRKQNKNGLSWQSKHDAA